MPATCVELAGAERPFRRAPQIEFVKLDPKGVGHIQYAGHLFGCVPLGRSGHPVIDLGQQNNLGCDLVQVDRSIFWEQTPFDIPGGNSELGRQLYCIALSAQLQRVHGRKCGQ